ncbi:HTH-type transcriptional regulator CysL [Shimia sp. SK013]|uniref:LysR family transcriptional regulator n=1 Tax=Shimia sp. SK013 TaxID=1389006 RepID=UPI0006B46C51|nr:LysR family transcriptional regulator [Shimia sp. SK013]KPA20648.1 HTH-type transcriptional regulator CysL [Shimia sp. SK013]
MLNATWLDTFTTLCDIGHFTRTADRLAMTQPGVSQHLRKLEAQVGQRLITQSGKSFSLTPAGEAVLQLGQTRRAQEAALRDSLTADDPSSGTVSLGCSGSFAMWAYPLMLQKMHDAPELVLRVTAAPQTSVIADVLSGTSDLGVVAQNPSHPRLTATRLAREELCLVLPKDFAPDTLSFAALNALGFVAHPDGAAYADELFGANFPSEYAGADRLRLRSFVNQIGQIPIPVAQGLGYTILPRTGVQAFAQADKLAVASLPEPQFHDLWLISRPGRTDFARIQAIAALITQAAATLDQHRTQS